MKQALVDALLSRADGKCECCNTPFGLGIFGRATIDHMFGKAKAPEDAEHCWVLRADHHRAKTDSHPSAVHWLRKFAAHCEKHGYKVARTRAGNRLLFAETKAGFGGAT